MSLKSIELLRNISSHQSLLMINYVLSVNSQTPRWATESMTESFVLSPDSSSRSEEIIPVIVELHKHVEIFS